MFRKRYKIGRRRSERSFTSGARRVHPKNISFGAMPMRGGIRL